jgi:hypothetical protein
MSNTLSNIMNILTGVQSEVASNYYEIYDIYYGEDSAGVYEYSQIYDPFITRNLGTLATGSIYGTTGTYIYQDVYTDTHSGSIPNVFSDPTENAIYQVLTSMNQATGLPIGLTFSCSTVTDTNIRAMVIYNIVRSKRLGSRYQSNSKWRHVSDGCSCRSIRLLSSIGGQRNPCQCIFYFIPSTCCLNPTIRNTLIDFMKHIE